MLLNAQSLEKENARREQIINDAAAREQQAKDAAAALDRILTPELRGQLARLKERRKMLAAICENLGADLEMLTGDPAADLDMWKQYLKETGERMNDIHSGVQKYLEFQQGVYDHEKM